MTIPVTDSPADVRVHLLVLPTREQDPASLGSNCKRPLDIANLTRRSDFRALDGMQSHATCHAHAQPLLAQSSDHAVPEYRIVEPHVSPCPSVKKAVAKKALGADERDRDT
eukprot:CAMPEP_0118812900 /NCGR_PEP_ID=MMETSP1162-20130426/2607_1 /TAXON_ID=33656 /ORGANISM="Phaeocystis Sp, Strain CCMP2710" /LENGTH=110 /DNA_ID=CAMNT_0006742659 /DNA_START=763 /DNA_END=1095 /DNA_ORIENTATION=+